METNIQRQVASFCRKKGLTADFVAILRKSRELFASAISMTVEIDEWYDICPVCDEAEYLRLEVTISGSYEDSRDLHDKWVNWIVSNISCETVGRFVLTLNRV